MSAERGPYLFRGRCAIAVTVRLLGLILLVLVLCSLFRGALSCEGVLLVSEVILSVDTTVQHLLAVIVLLGISVSLVIVFLV